MRKWQVQFEGLTCANPLFKWPVSTRFRYLDHLTANRMAPSMYPDPCGTGWGSWFQAILYHTSACFRSIFGGPRICLNAAQTDTPATREDTDKPLDQNCNCRTLDESSQTYQLGVQPPTSAVNVTLLAFAADRRPCPCSNRSISPAAGRSAANPQQQQCGGQMTGQTERRTYERYIDPALHSSQ